MDRAGIRNAAMAFDLDFDDDNTGISATAALAMAVFEQSGMKDAIDSQFDLDIRQKLSPGNSVKALIGDIMCMDRHKALRNVSNCFSTAPLDRLFGKGVTQSSLEIMSLSRNLDRLFSKDLPKLSYRCYRRLADRYGLDSKVFNIDSTNFGITALDKNADSLEAAIPQRCGHAKDGHHEKLVYSLLSVTDENRIVCYERPYDGATADSEMDRGAVEFLAGKVDPKLSTLVADCKIATRSLVELMCFKGFGFVAKCPVNFGKKIREDIVYSVSVGDMDPSAVRNGWEIYDTDAYVDGRKLRFVAYRTAEDIRIGIDYHRKQGLKEVKALTDRFRSRLYNCEVDAKRDLDEVLSLLDAYAFRVIWSIDPVEVSAGYGHRGRPRKSESPQTKTEYRVNIRLRFDPEKAKRLSRDRNVSVLVTNLPRATKDAENIRFGATADTVLLTYLGQYRVEHAFRLMKSGMGIDRVYIQKPSRENAMMFVISLTTMISNVMDHIFRQNGVGTTFASMVERMQRLDLRYDRQRDSSHLAGSREQKEEFMRAVRALNIDPDRLI